MLELLAKFYSKLPEGAKQVPAIGLLIVCVTTYISGQWMSSRACQALRDADQKETSELRTERDEYKKIAFNSVGFLAERAQQSAKLNEEATKPVPNAKPKPTVATVKVPVTPVTSQEKKDIEKPTDAQPATLEKKLDASTKVLKKTDISNATSVQTKQ